MKLPFALHWVFICCQLSGDMEKNGDATVATKEEVILHIFTFSNSNTVKVQIQTVAVTCWTLIIGNMFCSFAVLETQRNHGQQKLHRVFRGRERAPVEAPHRSPWPFPWKSVQAAPRHQVESARGRSSGTNGAFWKRIFFLKDLLLLNLKKKNLYRI